MTTESKWAEIADYQFRSAGRFMDAAERKENQAFLYRSEIANSKMHPLSKAARAEEAAKLEAQAVEDRLSADGCHDRGHQAMAKHTELCGQQLAMF